MFLAGFFSELKPAIVSTLIITLVLSILIILLSIKIKRVDPMKKTPLWLIPFIWIIEIINGFVKENIGVRWKSYAPWFLTLVIFIFFSNISAVYFLENPTGYLIVTVALSMCTFVVIQGTSFRCNGFVGYFKGYLDPNPVMLPMNIISEISLPISLALRLFGNVLSGTVVSILVKGALGWFAIPVMPLINALFDIAFSVIQVAVFVILSIIFTAMKIDDSEKIFTKN